MLIERSSSVKLFFWEFLGSKIQYSSTGSGFVIFISASTAGRLYCYVLRTGPHGDEEGAHERSQSLSCSLTPQSKKRIARFVLLCICAMVRGHAKSDAQAKNAKKMEAMKKAGSQHGMADKAMGHICPICKQQFPHIKLYKQHFDSKHPNETFQAAAMAAIQAAEAKKGGGGGGAAAEAPAKPKKKKAAAGGGDLEDLLAAGGVAGGKKKSGKK